jgi:hypothetical protein
MKSPLLLELFHKHHFCYSMFCYCHLHFMMGCDMVDMLITHLLQTYQMLCAFLLFLRN